MTFDPDSAAAPGSGVFGLPHSAQDARVLLIPAPFDATTSSRAGAAAGPATILDASRQVDLHDLRFGAVHECGIHMTPIDESLAALSRRAGALARPLIEKGGAEASDAPAVREIDAAGETVNAHVRARAAAALERRQIPGVVGGDHSVPFGAIEACAAQHGEIGVLQIDAHMDLREAFEGFAWSHASIMHNALARIGGVVKLAQIGIREAGISELECADRSGGRVRAWMGHDWWRRARSTEGLDALCDEVIAWLPERVYVSFDIDGLDPSLCPNTGTPVPGGLGYEEARTLLERLARSGKSIVGFDLCEVCAGVIDGAVAARILYSLCGAARVSNDL